MFTNERLFTIQAFTITRVHCTYILNFGTDKVSFKIGMISKHVEMDAILVIKISINFCLSPISFVKYQENLAVTYQWLELWQSPKEELWF